MALTFFRPRGDVKANWEAANPILKEREMAIEWETTIGVGQPRIKFGKAGGTTHYNDTDYAVLPLKYNTRDGWATDNPILAVGEMGIEWETTIGEGAVCIKFGNGTTAWNSLEYASTGRLKEIIEPETKNTPVAVGDTLPMIAGKVNSQQDFLKTKLGYERLDALAASLSGLSNQDFVGIMDFINQKKFDKSSVYNGVDSTNTELALAASQGKTLHDQITTLNSNLTPSKITDVTNAINTTYGSGNVSYHTVGKVCFVYFVFTPNQKCDNVELIGNGILPLAKDSLYHSISTWGNPDVAVSLVQTITTGGLRFWCGESAKGMQIFDSFSYCVK